jgi:transposase-like protein
LGCNEKVHLIEETLQAGETVIARRHGSAASLLFTWRQQARENHLGSEPQPTLVSVEITSAPAPISTGAPQSPSPPAHRTRVEMIEVGIRSRRYFSLVHVR